MNCALAIERSYQGEHGVFVGLFRAPEQQTIGQLQEALAWYKHQPLEKVGVFRQALRVSRAPTAGPAAPLVEHAERLGVQAGQAVRHVRPDQLRRPRRRVAPPDLAPDDDPDLRPDLRRRATSSSS